jgi:predicted transcriptional regulator
MDDGEVLTTLAAFEQGTLRLASRIHDAKKSGVPIFSEWVIVAGHRVKKYSTRPFDGSQLPLFGEESADE